MDQKTEELRGVISHWLRLSLGKPPAGVEHLADLNAIDWTGTVKASDLWTMIRSLGLDFETLYKDPARAVGDKLRDAKDRTFELDTIKGNKLKVVLRGRSKNNAMHWWLDCDRVDEVRVTEPRVVPF
jgi:hypothetical protein